MTSVKQYRIFFGVCACIGLGSVLLSLMVIISWLKYRDPTKKTVQALLLDYIGIIAICDIMMTSKNMIYFLFGAINSDIIPELPQYMCVILGFINQFIDMLTLNFSFSLAIFVLYPLLLHKSPYIISQNKTCNINNYCIIICLALLLSVPLLFVGAYGFTNPGTSDMDYPEFKKFQCWIQTNHDAYSLVEYLTAFLCMLLSVISLFVILFHCIISDNAWKWVIKQCSIYLSLFILQWIFNCVNRLYDLYHHNTGTPFIIICLAWITMSSRGIMNNIIWNCITLKSQYYKNTFKSMSSSHLIGNESNEGIIKDSNEHSIKLFSSNTTNIANVNK